MIHLTVAAPMGLDSLFFSFVQRLAVRNGHICVASPGEGTDDDQQAEWIERMNCSGKHHFVIGYRYPPRYWERLVDHAASVAVLVDGDGIARQLERIYRQEQEKGEGRDLRQCLQGMRHAVDAMLDLTEQLLRDPSPTRLLPLAWGFHQDPAEAFRRLESFYSEAGVVMCNSCWRGFSEEAQPLLAQIEPPATDVRRLIHKVVSLDEAGSSRLEAVDLLFSHSD